jgi:hypothetical protein
MSSAARARDACQHGGFSPYEVHQNINLIRSALEPTSSVEEYEQPSPGGHPPGPIFVDIAPNETTTSLESYFEVPGIHSFFYSMCTKTSGFIGRWKHMEHVGKP